MEREPVLPNLFHKLLCLHPLDLSSSQFFAALYQFSVLCWDTEKPERPWKKAPIPADLDPTGSGIQTKVNLHMLHLNVMGFGGYEMISQTNGWVRIAHMSNLSYYGIEHQGLGPLCMEIYEKYLKSYEFYSGLVRDTYWKQYFAPRNYKYTGTRRDFLLDDARWNDEIEQRGPRTDLFVGLRKEHMPTYERLMNQLRESILLETDKTAAQLVFQDAVGLHLVPDPELLPVNEGNASPLRPSDSVSVIASEGGPELGVRAYTPYDLDTLDYYPPMNPRFAVEHRIAMFRNRITGGQGKVTPPPPVIRHVDEYQWTPRKPSPRPRRQYMFRHRDNSDRWGEESATAEDERFEAVDGSGEDYDDGDDEDEDKDKDEDEEHDGREEPRLADYMESHVMSKFEDDYEELVRKFGLSSQDVASDGCDAIKRRPNSFLDFDFGDYLKFAGVEELGELFEEWISFDPGMRVGN